MRAAEAPDGAKRATTNAESWRKSAVQVVSVTHGSSGGVHATIHATTGSTAATIALVEALAKALPPSEIVYAVGPRNRAVTPKQACEIAIADYLNGGENGRRGELL